MSLLLWVLVTWAGLAAVLLVAFLSCCRAALHDDRSWDARRAAAAAGSGLSLVAAPDLAALAALRQRRAPRSAPAARLRMPS